MSYKMYSLLVLTLVHQPYCIFDVFSLGLFFQLLLFRVALGVMKNETSRFYPFVCMRNILHKACTVGISNFLRSCPVLSFS